MSAQEPEGFPKGFPREATEEELRELTAALATPERLAGVVGPPIRVMTQRDGALPSVVTMARIICAAIARDPLCQEIGFEVDTEDALELARGIMLVPHEAVDEAAEED